MTVGGNLHQALASKLGENIGTGLVASGFRVFGALRASLSRCLGGLGLGVCGY